MSVTSESNQKDEMAVDITQFVLVDTMENLMEESEHYEERDHKLISTESPSNSENLIDELTDSTVHMIVEKDSAVDIIPEDSTVHMILEKDSAVDIIPKEDSTIRIIPGLKDAIQNKSWTECISLMKKHIGMKALEVQQLQCAKEYDNVLEIVVQKGFIELIKLFFNNGFHVDEGIKGWEGKTALHICAEKGYFKILDLLIKKGSDIQAKCAYGYTALYYAAKKGCYNSVKLLLDNGINANIKTGNGTTALHIAASRGHFKVVTLLCEYGADVYIKDVHKHTVLMVAVCHGHMNIVKYLLDYGYLDTKAICVHNKTALDYAKAGKHDDIINLLSNLK